MVSATPLRLISIPVSHYCEKARWALERAGLPYREIRHVQVFHYAATLWHARSLYAPVLLTPEGPITDSTEILHYADRNTQAAPRLFPNDPAERARVQEWEDVFDEVLGVEVRRWMYHVGFTQLGRPRMLALAAQGTPAWQGALMKPLLRLAEAYVRFRLDIDASTVQAGLQRVREVFARVDTELSDGRRFLTGDRFTAADLTFASLSSFVLMPPRYGVRLLELEELPEDMRRTVDSFRETRAGRFALGLYERERE